EPTPVGGVGIVVGLEGTGGDCPPDDYRSMLENDLRRQGVNNPRAVLADPGNAMVLVSALVPAGAHKGDLIDLEVRLPPRSRATGLRGGVLKLCMLYDYQTTRRLNTSYKGPEALLWGHPVAAAEGAVLVGFGEGDEEAREKQGKLWGGGRT